MIYISDHAALRFAQRVMGQEVAELSFDQEKNIKAKILQTLKPMQDVIQSLTYGSFRIDSMCYVVDELVVVTVKSAKSFSADARGGAMRSGRKIKKKRQPTKRSDR